MTIETATYINQLNSSYPEGGADRSTADDHLRLIKATVLATFPAVTGPVTVTHTELNLLSGASTTLASISALTTKFSLSISAVVTDVARISQTVSVVIARVNTLSASVSLVQADVARISQTVSVVIADVARISLSVSAVVTDVARISQTVSVVIARVNTLSASVSLVQADVARISVTVSAIWTRINTLSASVSLIQATILGGTYAPTLVAKTNIASFDSTIDHNYIRLGAVVAVWGRVMATPAGTGVMEFYVPLPIASSIPAVTSIVGSGYNDDVGSIAITADAVNNRAIVYGVAGTVASLIFMYNFSYTIT